MKLIVPLALSLIPVLVAVLATRSIARDRVRNARAMTS